MSADLKMIICLAIFLMYSIVHALGLSYVSIEDVFASPIRGNGSIIQRERGSAICLSISTFCSHILHDDSCVCRENMLREYIPRFGWMYGGGCVDKLPLNLYLILATCLNVSVGYKSSQC